MSTEFRKRRIKATLTERALRLVFLATVCLSQASKEGRALEIDESKSVYAQAPIQVPDTDAQWFQVDQRKAHVAQLLKRAKAGDAKAASTLGQAYRAGKCVTPNFAEARCWLDIAARGGDVAAMKQLAAMQDEGEGGPIDGPASLRMLEQAAGRGDAEAMLALGVALWRGDRVAPDEARAKTWLERARTTATAESAAIADEADWTLSEMARRSLPGKAGLTAARPFVVSILIRHGWLEKLDEQLAGHVMVDRFSGLAMLELGRCFELGIGGPADPAAAERWFIAAAAGPFSGVAAKKLASMKGAWSEPGWDDRRFDLNVLEELFQLSNGADHFPDRFTLDLIFPPGEATPAPARAAVDALLAKAKKGDATAAEMAGLMALAGWGMPRDAAQAIKWFELAAKASPYGQARRFLGTMALLGEGQPRDAGRAKRYFDEALGGEGGWYQHTMFLRALVAPQGKAVVPDFEQRLAAIADAAERGDAVAQLRRARQYLLGIGVMPDAEAASRWYAAAARQNHPAALYELAGLYDRGIGVLGDRNETLRLRRKAAAAGFAMAAHDLSIAHAPSSGWDAPKSARESLRWDRRMAELGMVQGLIEAIRKLERDRNFSDLVTWYSLPAAQEQAENEARLARLLRLGLGVPRDLPRARSIYEAIAKKGPPPYELGLMLELGQGGPVDLKRAIAIYRKAADERSQEAMFRLGVLHEEGRGVKRDFKRANHWYHEVLKNETAEGGPEADATHEARYRLGRMLEEGRGASKDLKAAVDYYRASESAYAVRRLGDILERGTLGKPNKAEALKRYYDYFRLDDLWHGPDLDFLERSAGDACITEDLATVATLLEQAVATDPHAAVLLGRLFEHGVGVPWAPTVARTLYESAAKRGFAEGSYRLGAQAEEEESKGGKARAAAAYRAAIQVARSRYDLETFGSEESTPYLEALKWLHKTRNDIDLPEDRGFNMVSYLVSDEPDLWRPLIERVEAGDEDADLMYDAWLLQAGAIRNLDGAAIAELGKKADAGSISALLTLVVRHAAVGDRAGFERRYSRVVEVATSGDRRAQAVMGHLLLSGKVIASDRPGALYWLTIGAMQGHGRAKSMLGELAERMTPGERLKVEEQAIVWWRSHRHALASYGAPK